MSIVSQLNPKRLDSSLLYQTTPARRSPRRNSISFSPPQFSTPRSQNQQGTVSLTDRTLQDKKNPLPQNTLTLPFHVGEYRQHLKNLPPNSTPTVVRHTRRRQDYG
ncbi:hypothetical protein TNCV_4474471 [Trichonephila clavipes]|nr:hypothetical protein TNCV_4474471 [Trichonephila clavipes]